jgi:hypothetical protein
VSFPLSFPYPFEAGYLPADPGTLPLVYDGQHATEAIDLLIEQFKRQPTIDEFLSIYIDQVQELEESLWRLLTERRLDNATGAALDGIGAIVGEAREGRDDDTYRAFVRARILIDRTRGRALDIAGVIAAIVSPLVNSFPFEIREYFPAKMSVRLLWEIDGDLAALIAKALRLTKAVSVGFDLTFSSLAPSTVFSLSESGDFSEFSGLGWTGDPALGGGLARTL